MAGVEITGIGIHPFGRFDGVTVTNNSDSVASEGVAMTLTATSGVEFTGASGDGWTCATTATTVSCTLGSPLAPGALAGVTPEVVRTAGACETSSARVVVTNGIHVPDGASLLKD